MTTQALTTNDFALIDGRYGLAEFLFANQSGLTLNDATVLAEKIVASWLPEIVHTATEQGREAGRDEFHMRTDHYHGLGVTDGRRRF